MLSHEIPLSHGGTRLNSAWQVLRLVLGRQTAEFHQRDGERLQPKVTDNLFFFFFKQKFNLGSLELFNPASLARSLLVFPFAGCSEEGSGCCCVIPCALEQNHLSVQPPKSHILLQQRLLREPLVLKHPRAGSRTGASTLCTSGKEPQRRVLLLLGKTALWFPGSPILGGRRTRCSLSPRLSHRPDAISRDC